MSFESIQNIVIAHTKDEIFYMNYSDNCLLLFSRDVDTFVGRAVFESEFSKFLVEDLEPES